MKNKILFAICILFGLMFVNAGLNKFLNYMPVPADMPESMKLLFEAVMKISWLLPLVGFVEITAGLLFMLPKYRALGAIMVFPVMIGILLTNIVNAPSGLPIAIVLLAINLWVIYENRKKYMPMIV